MSVVNKFTNIFSDIEIDSILDNELVIAKRHELTSLMSKVKFSVELSGALKDILESKLGLSLRERVPMRWVKGDTSPHVDKGESFFSTTYLIYLTNSKGKFVINGTTHDICKGDAFVFSEGLSHETIDTGDDERLLIGPMSEFGFAVGADDIYYYQSYNDALLSIDQHVSVSSPTLVVANNTELVPSSFPIFNGSWIIYSCGYPDLVGTTVYPGETLRSGSTYVVYTSYPCFLEGTKILCKVNEEEKYLPIEQLEQGVLVKTSLHGYKKIDMIGNTKIYNPGNRVGRPPHSLYCCSKSKYDDLFEDLYITGYHSILSDRLTTEQKAKTFDLVGKIYVTDNKYRLMACVDDRAEPFEEIGLFTIWHIALENNDYYRNYGIYANGLLVETTSKRYLKELSGMTLK